MRALVTGGAGFIGSNLVDALIDAGHDVAVLDNLSTGRHENLDGALARGAQLQVADIAEPGAAARVIGELRPEAIFHLAAQIDVRRSVREPAFDARVNVEGTINMLEAAVEHRVGRLVFTSTGGAIYGETDRLPTPEDAEAQPLSAYGTSKFCGERYCGLFERLHGLSTVILRYGNVYGPRQDPLGEAGVVAIFCGKLLAGQPAQINGDGRQTRDYVYVGDVVRANLVAVGRPQATGAFNVGTGRETSVLEIVEALRELGGGEFPHEHAPPPPGEVRRSCLDVSRAARELDWRAQTSLEEGLAITLDAARAGAGS